jgi:hypothetical protein
MRKTSKPQSSPEVKEKTKAEYHLDYGKSRPNRFAGHLNSETESRTSKNPDSELSGILRTDNPPPSDQEIEKIT